MNKKGIKELLYELIAVQSDTGTSLEKAMAAKIVEYIGKDSYFQAHPAQWGAEAENDILGRPVVWALKKGKTNRTVILAGHYDCVEIDCYGRFRHLALKPDELKEQLALLPLVDDKLKEHLRSGDWLVGRGSADMKAGLAIDLSILLGEEEPNATILFLAVPDEENISAGMRYALPILCRLREQFDLDYRVTLIGESQFREDDDSFVVYNGGTGKILPMIVARGRLSHSAAPMKGLNAAHIIAEITRNVDLNPTLCTEDLGVATQPPVVQAMCDLKTTYDVSMPLFAAASVNILFLNSKNPLIIMEKLKSICRFSMKSVIDKYEESFAYALHRGLVSESDRQTYAPVVMDLRELEEIVKSNKDDYESFRADLEAELTRRISDNDLTLPTASLHYMKSMIQAAGLDYPLVVVGISPPYYPATCNEYLGSDLSGILGSIRSAVDPVYRKGISLAPYNICMGDSSYVTCVHPGEERALMANLTLPRSMYDIPFEAASSISAPCFYLGPRGEDVHQWSERVYLPDVEYAVPAAIQKIIENL